MTTYWRIIGAINLVFGLLNALMVASLPLEVSWGSAIGLPFCAVGILLSVDGLTKRWSA